MYHVECVITGPTMSCSGASNCYFCCIFPAWLSDACAHDTVLSDNTVWTVWLVLNIIKTDTKHQVLSQFQIRLS